MGLPPPSGGDASPAGPAMRGAHRLPIGEDGEEGDQRKTLGFPLDSFPLMTGAGDIETAIQPRRRTKTGSSSDGFSFILDFS